VFALRDSYDARGAVQCVRKSGGHAMNIDEIRGRARSAVTEDDVMELVDDATRKLRDGNELRDRRLGNLLAVIHGDGGHHQIAVGTAQACMDAEATVHYYRARIAELENRVDSADPD
jgi:hypothetical protein